MCSTMDHSLTLNVSFPLEGRICFMSPGLCDLPDNVGEVKGIINTSHP